MRCKKHPADQSGGVGVCASCLRERLVAVIAAQAQAHAMKHALQDCRKSDSQLPQPPLLFPRSVSPYISRRKSDTGGGGGGGGGVNQLFYSTPQAVNRNRSSIAVEVKKNSRSRISSLFWGFFRSKAAGKPDPVADPIPAVAIDSYSASPAWFRGVAGGRRRRKNVSTFSSEESAFRSRGRGMSPARQSDLDDEQCHGGASGYSSDSWRQTPRRTPTSARRANGGGRAASHGKSLSGLTFCLSPLVRPSPNRHWNQKAAAPEAAAAAAAAGESKAHLSTAASFCKNRSRKLADFGRYPYDPTC